MSISADQERAYYDALYSRFLALPDHALAVNRQSLYRLFNDPSQTQWERRRLYLRAMDALLSETLEGLHVLDYGCGPAEWGVWMATEGAEVTLLDLSPAAIQLGLRRAAASGVASSVRGEARDASDLRCFPDASFDLIFANAALHHTLKYPNAFEELLRVLKPGGRLVLAETFGNNPLLNVARRFRAWASREPEEQGEEIVLSDAEVDLLRRNLRDVHLEPLHLLAMAKRLFRGRFQDPFLRAFIGLLESIDKLLLRLAPSLGRYCGEVVIQARR